MAPTNNFPDVTLLQRRFSSLMLFLLLLHFLCAPTFTDSTSIEGETYLAEWPDEGPSLRLYPKSPTTGEAIKEEYFGWDVLGFQEKVLCNCCRDATLGMKVLSCDDDLPEGMSPLVDLRQNATWTLEELIPVKKISWTTNNFAGGAIMQFVFEDLNEDLSVNMTFVSPFLLPLSIVLCSLSLSLSLSFSRSRTSLLVSLSLRQPGS
ncbi:hypothetical protein QOT17_005813 [Balamuthia mandrillaris]